MKQILNHRNLVVVFAIIIFSAVSFFVGGNIGFDKEFEAKTFYDGVDGYLTVLILRYLREGTIDSAISALEGKLITEGTL